MFLQGAGKCKVWRFLQVLIGHVRKKLNKQTFPERCSLCQAPLPFNDGKQAVCENGHAWLRSEPKKKERLYLSPSEENVGGAAPPGAWQLGHKLNLNAKFFLWQFICPQGAVIEQPTVWYLPKHTSHLPINIIRQAVLLLAHGASAGHRFPSPRPSVAHQCCFRQTSVSVLFLCLFWVCVCVCVSLSLPIQLPHVFVALSSRCVLSYQACQALTFRRCLLQDSVARLPEPEGKRHFPSTSSSVPQPSSPVTLSDSLRPAPPRRSSPGMLDFRPLEQLMPNNPGRFLGIGLIPFVSPSLNFKRQLETIQPFLSATIYFMCWIFIFLGSDTNFPLNYL